MRLSVVAAAVVLVAVAASVLYLGSGGGARGDRVVFAILPVEDSAPIVVAQEEGLFEKHGIVADVQLYRSAKERDSALLSGQADIAVSDPVTGIIMVSRGVDVRIAALLLGARPEEGVFYLLAPPGSNTTVEGLEEVAVSRNTIIEYVTWRMLEKLGRDPRSIRLVDVPSIPVRMQLLLQGKVQAACLPDPFATIALSRGAVRLADDSMFGESISQSVLLVRGSLAPSVLKRVVKALNEAVSLLNRNPEAYRPLLVERLRLPPDLGAAFKVGHRTPLQPYPEENFEDVLAWLRERGLLGREVSYPEAVTTAGFEG